MAKERYCEKYTACAILKSFVHGVAGHILSHTELCGAHAAEDSNRFVRIVEVQIVLPFVMSQDCRSIFFLK